MAVQKLRFQLKVIHIPFDWGFFFLFYMKTGNPWGLKNYPCIDDLFLISKTQQIKLFFSLNLKHRNSFQKLNLSKQEQYQKEAEMKKINIALPNMNAWNIQQQSTSIKFRTLIKSNNYLHNEVDAIFEEAILFFDVKPN